MRVQAGGSTPQADLAASLVWLPADAAPTQKQVISAQPRGASALGSTLLSAEAVDRGSLDDAIDWIESIPFSETRNYVQAAAIGA